VSGREDGGCDLSGLGDAFFLFLLLFPNPLNRVSHLLFIYIFALENNMYCTMKDGEREELTFQVENIICLFISLSFTRYIHIVFVAKKAEREKEEAEGKGERLCG
jgi:hypothetical protein